MFKKLNDFSAKILFILYLFFKSPVTITYAFVRIIHDMLTEFNNR